MKKDFINQYVEAAGVKRALLATLIFLILLYMIDYSPIGVAGLLKLTKGANILDFENGYSFEKAYGMLERLGESGRHFYLTRILPLDILFPIGFMLFNNSWLSLFLKGITKNGSRLRKLICITVMELLCDWGENIGFVLMLLYYPERLKTVCAVSSQLTKLKFLGVGIIGLLLLITLVCAAVKAVKKAILH